ncbi:hypothetical protein F5146DRAFT_1142095 [Armillaria mellea]|nr:hypothetical protein F5146DRAFT_1142095 [Armillaria mellea]
MASDSGFIMLARHSSEGSISQQGSTILSALCKVIVTTDNCMFLALAADDLAPIPETGQADPSKQMSSRFPVDPTEYLQQGWWINSIPYQSFVPVDTYTACRCHPLRCLNYTQESWITQDGKGFQHEGALGYNFQGMQHIGTFVDVTVCKILGAFEKMITVGVLLWLAWGTVNVHAAGRYPIVQYTPSVRPKLHMIKDLGLGLWLSCIQTITGEMTRV